MLKAWIFEPAGLSTPSGVPATSRMNTGTSTLGPSAVTVWTVIASCAAAAPASARLPKTAMRIFFMGTLFAFPRRFRTSRLDGCSAHLQRPRRNRGGARAGGVAQQRQLRIDTHAHV